MSIKVPVRDGQKIGVRVIGRGKPVILLHGFGSESRHWLPNILPFIHKYQFILPDLRGFGLSHHVDFNSDNVFLNYADDIQDIVSYLNLDRFYLGGISTGAYSCLVYNATHGFEQVEKYLNIEHSHCSVNDPSFAHGLFRENQAEIFDHFLFLLDELKHIEHPLDYWTLPETLRLHLRDTMTDLFVRSLHNPVGKRIISSARHAEKILAGRLFPVENLKTYFHIMKSFMHGEDTQNALAQVKAPIYIMAGGRSEFFSVKAQEVILQQAPLANLTVFKRSGHIPIVDRPIAFQREFSRFLKEPTDQFKNKQIKYI